MPVFSTGDYNEKCSRLPKVPYPAPTGRNIIAVGIAHRKQKQKHPTKTPLPETIAKTGQKPAITLAQRGNHFYDIQVAVYDSTKIVLLYIISFNYFNIILSYKDIYTYKKIVIVIIMVQKPTLLNRRFYRRSWAESAGCVWDN
jgi:hypothetical protein